MGFSAKCINILRAIYAVTEAKVWTKSGYTEVFPTVCGVRQGCLLSPLLFALFINDMWDEIEEGGFCFNGTWIRMLMYADDVVFMASEPEVLQKMIDKLSGYCQKWDLMVNLNKSKIMVFRKKGPLKKSLEWFYRGTKIEIVSQYKYLGVLFVTTGKFGTHLSAQLAVAKLAINTVYRKIFSLQACNLDSFLKIFNAVARSIMCYSAQIWGYHKHDVVERIFRFFIKKLFRLPYNTPNYVLYLETGHDTIFIYALKLQWSFILQTLRLGDSRYRKIMLEIGIVNRHNWFKALEKTARSYDMWEQFLNFTFDSIKKPIDCLYELVVQKERQNHLDQVLLGQFHPTYKNLKLEWGREEYLNLKLPVKQVRHIMMARSDMLPLASKPWYFVGNFNCLYCNLHSEETTQHFVAECPVWREFRTTAMCNNDFFDILRGKIGWKDLILFISGALNYRAHLDEEFA